MINKNKMTKNIFFYNENDQKHCCFYRRIFYDKRIEDVYCKGFWKVVRTIAVLLEIIILIKFEWTRFQSE
jgi:argonaute-like protein implicated in RNA metabolism and viral defense